MLLFNQVQRSIASASGSGEKREGMKMKYTLLKNKVTGERSIRISGTDERVLESVNPVEYARLRKLAVGNIRRAQKDEVMRSLGLVKVKGGLGGVYWE